MGAKHDVMARVTERFSLRYAEGPDPALDRPAHVRAASGLAFVETQAGRRLAVAQDDALFLALVDTKSREVTSLPLPAGEGGLRQFDSLRGNKKHKLDLEALFACELDGAPSVVAVGSGSSPKREVFVTVRFLSSGTEVRVAHLPSLYASFRARADFAGSELNLEGAALMGDRLVLFQRGNGAPSPSNAGGGALLPVDATGSLSWPALLSHLADPASPPPALEDVKAWDLGLLEGVRLTFTDAAPLPSGGLLYLATAEASPNAVDDGEVVGGGIGVLDDEGLHPGRLLDERGELLREKPEGIALDPDAPDVAWMVLDRDDPTVASELCRVHLAWGAS